MAAGFSQPAVKIKLAAATTASNGWKQRDESTRPLYRRGPAAQNYFQLLKERGRLVRVLEFKLQLVGNRADD